MVDTVRPRVSARSAKARASSALACTGTRLAPTWQAATQLAALEAAPHLAAQPARLEGGGPRPVVDEDVHDRVTAGQRQEGVEVRRPQGAHPVAGREHEGSLRGPRPDRDPLVHRVARVAVARVTGPVPSSREGRPAGSRSRRPRGCADCCEPRAPSSVSSTCRPCCCASWRPPASWSTRRTARSASSRPDGSGLEQFIHVGMDPADVERIGHLPEGKGLLGALIDDPRPIRLARPPGRPALGRLPGGPPADERASSASRSGSGTRSSATSTSPTLDRGRVHRRGRGAGLRPGRHRRRRDRERPALRGRRSRRQTWLQASTDMTRELLVGAAPSDALRAHRPEHVRGPRRRRRRHRRAARPGPRTLTVAGRGRRGRRAS